MAERRGDDGFLDTALAPGAGADLVPGATFAQRYEVQALLGRGGMGAVYRVRDRELGEVVALKVVSTQGGAAGEAVERFRREIRLARRVTHRNVARTYDLGEHGGIRYLTMEHVEGQSLQRLITTRRRLPASEAAAIALQIAEALSAAHAADVVHRDLKPGNVLIARDGRVVVIDFGIARALSAPAATFQTQGTLGTPAYMAPEQVAGEPVDVRADIFALGCILYEMVSGQLPFDGETPVAAALARLTREPRDLAAMADEAPPALVAVVHACLARAPDARPSLDDVRAVLAEAAGTVPAATGSGAVAHATGARTSASKSSTHAPAPTWLPSTPQGRTLAVLPFRYRGPPDGEFLAAAMTEELIDVLSMTRGLRVPALGAVARHAGAPDPREVGAQLHADVVVDATVQAAGETVRISARLVEVSNGIQIWSERFEGHSRDAFALQEHMAKRIAEALRVQLGNITLRMTAPPEATELYVKARQALMQLRMEPTAALEYLDRCLALAPDFPPALALRATASLRKWFVVLGPDSAAAGEQAREAVDAALERAPDHAESHVAHGMLRAHLGEYREAARALARALEIAPTCAPALAYLGRLQIEAGMVDEGEDRVRLAVELDPNLATELLEVARARALRGDLAEYDRLVEIARRTNSLAPYLLNLEMRVGAWFDQPERIERAMATIAGSDSPGLQGMAGLGMLFLGNVDTSDATEAFKTLADSSRNARWATMICQFACEYFGRRGEVETALDWLERAAAKALVDVSWTDLCPALASIRGTPRFTELRRRIRGRAYAIWEK